MYNCTLSIGVIFVRVYNMVLGHKMACCKNTPLGNFGLGHFIFPVYSLCGVRIYRSVV